MSPEYRRTTQWDVFSWWSTLRVAIVGGLVSIRYGYLNDLGGRHVTREDVFAAIKNAKSGPVEEGSVGAGTGTVAFGFKGGIGTSSRRLPSRLGGYTVGVLVQTNFGGVLTIAGAPVGRELDRYYLRDELKPQTNVDPGNGSVMIIIATDAPVDAR